MNQHIFREYDIRGIFPDDLTEDIVKKIGYYFGLKIKEKNMDYIAVGYDCRTHSHQLFEWIISGLNKAEIKVLNVGEVPTPCVYFAANQEYNSKLIKNCLVITGSHNPPEYNGFKLVLDNEPFFGEDIINLGKEVMSSTEEILDDIKVIDTDYKEMYIQFLVEHFSNLKDCSKKVIIDNGNGVGSIVAREVLDRLGISCEILFENPDGTFPNHLADPSEDENLEDVLLEMKNNSYDIGCAFDGDADRIHVIDQNQVIKPDVFALIIAKTMDNPIVVGEVKCTQIMYDGINEFGKAIMQRNGRCNVQKKIKEVNATFAIELSGHIFFNDRYYGYDDAIYTFLRTIELVNSGLNFKEEFDKLPKVYSTPEYKVKTSEKEKFVIIEKFVNKVISKEYDLPKIIDYTTIDGIRVKFEHGWALVRVSNTSPNFTTRFEADTEENANLYKEKMLDCLYKEIKENE